MTSVHGSSADPVVLHIDNACEVPSELLDGLSDCTAFVNWRRIEVGEPAILALSFWRTQPQS